MLIYNTAAVCSRVDGLAMKTIEVRGDGNCQFRAVAELALGGQQFHLVSMEAVGVNAFHCPPMKRRRSLEEQEEDPEEE